MEYKVINPQTNEIVRDAIATVASTQLIFFLYEIALRSSKQYKVIYNYNFSNRQTIQFIDKQTKYIHEFTNVPTHVGLFNCEVLEQDIRAIYERAYKGGEK